MTFRSNRRNSTYLIHLIGKSELDRKLPCWATREQGSILPGEKTMQIYGPSQIHGAQGINGPHTTRAVQGASTSETSSLGDRLDISEAGQIAGRLAEVPDMRADRVRDIRAAIQGGTYETEAKLNTAIDRVLDEIA